MSLFLRLSLSSEAAVEFSGERLPVTYLRCLSAPASICLPQRFTPPTSGLVDPRLRSGLLQRLYAAMLQHMSNADEQELLAVRRILESSGAGAGARGGGGPGGDMDSHMSDSWETAPEGRQCW